MNPPISPFDRTSAFLILGSIACIGLYILAVAYAGAQLEAQLEDERRLRSRYERLADEREHQLDGALAKIHEMGDDGGGEQPPGAGA